MIWQFLTLGKNSFLREKYTSYFKCEQYLRHKRNKNTEYSFNQTCDIII